VEQVSISSGDGQTPSDHHGTTDLLNALNLPILPRPSSAPSSLAPPKKVAVELIGCLLVKRQPSNMLTIEGLAIQVAWTCLLVYIV
jgi:hypothetical protein